MRGPRHGNGRPHIIGRTNRDPLRKIVDRFTGHGGVPMERLECGHGQPVRSDMIGPTAAKRRRCGVCGDKLRAAEAN